jgi:hypothetical protein
MSGTGGPETGTEHQIRQHRSMWRLNFVILVVTAIGVLVAAATWLGLGLPGIGTGTDKGMTTPESTGAGLPRASTGTPAVPAGNAVALSDLPPQAGAANLVALPKALREDPAFAGSLAISCPTNQTNDRHREVTYLLRGQHSDFTARIQSSFPDNPTLRATLTVIGGYKERDGTITRREISTGLATAGQWATLSADVERAEEMTLRVRCDEPAGVVILSRGQVSRAA